MDKLQKWGKELTSNISDVLERYLIRQDIINDFLCSNDLKYFLKLLLLYKSSTWIITIVFPDPVR